MLSFILARQGFANQLDQYHLRAHLGSGHYSEVLLYEHRKTKVKYAIKIIEARTFEKKVARYTNEIELQERCKKNPNVVHFKE